MILPMHEISGRGMPICCSICIAAYNEEDNIEIVLKSLLSQKLRNIYINEIIIVVSGCTDRTVEITERFLARDPRIQLYIQEKREGKASALNLFLKKCSEAIIVILNADLLLEENTIQNLVEPFFDPAVGMTGGRAISVNSRDTFMGFTSYLLWETHHCISLKYPKLGELVAYRKLKELDFSADTVDDEGIIEAIITRQGYKLYYAPNAIFYNKGPLVLSEYLQRRRNIFAGHMQLYKKTSYVVSTVSLRKLILGVLPYLVRVSFQGGKYFFWTVAIVVLEVWARFLGAYDFYVLKRDHRIWKQADSAKQLRYNERAIQQG